MSKITNFPKLDKKAFSINQKMKHSLEDFAYIQAVAYGYLGKSVPQMDKTLTGMRKHMKK